MGDFITIEPSTGNDWEIMYGSVFLSSGETSGTISVIRGTESTNEHTVAAGKIIYMAGSQESPMEWLSGDIQGVNRGTVHNIDIEKHGTVFRWF